MKRTKVVGLLARSQGTEKRQKIECPNCCELDNHTVHDTSYYNYNLSRSVWFKRYTCGVCGYNWRAYDDLKGNKE